jgi:Phosphopantetheine attachment site
MRVRDTCVSRVGADACWDTVMPGGHSLSAVQVAAAIEKLLDRSLSPGLLFEAPTIELLASRLGTPSPDGAALVPLMGGTRERPCFGLGTSDGCEAARLPR